MVSALLRLLGGTQLWTFTLLAVYITMQFVTGTHGAVLKQQEGDSSSAHTVERRTAKPAHTGAHPQQGSSSGRSSNPTSSSRSSTHSARASNQGVVKAETKVVNNSSHNPQGHSAQASQVRTAQGAISPKGHNSQVHSSEGHAVQGPQGHVAQAHSSPAHSSQGRGSQGHIAQGHTSPAHSSPGRSEVIRANSLMQQESSLNSTPFDEVTFAGFAPFVAHQRRPHKMIAGVEDPMAVLDSICTTNFGSSARVALGTEILDGVVSGLPIGPRGPARGTRAAMVGCTAVEQCLTSDGAWRMAVNTWTDAWPHDVTSFVTCSFGCNQAICVRSSTLLERAAVSNEKAAESSTSTTPKEAEATQTPHASNDPTGSEDQDARTESLARDKSLLGKVRLQKHQMALYLDERMSPPNSKFSRDMWTGFVSITFVLTTLLVGIFYIGEWNEDMMVANMKH